FIIFLVLTVALLTSGGLFYVAIASTNNNYTVITEGLRTCAPEAPDPSGQMIILRIDDVQDYASHAATIQMIEDAEAKGMPVVAGVIPKDVTLDQSLVDYLRTKECNIEIALHGYDHQPIERVEDGTRIHSAEFERLSAREARTRIAKGLRE